MKELLGSEYADLPIVVIFSTEPGRVQELEEVIKEDIEKRDKRANLKTGKEEFTCFKITHSGSKLVLQIKPESTIKPPS